MGIAGIGVIGRCALKILGPFEVSYIPKNNNTPVVRFGILGFLLLARKLTGWPIAHQLLLPKAPRAHNLREKLMVLDKWRFWIAVDLGRAPLSKKSPNLPKKQKIRILKSNTRYLKSTSTVPQILCPPWLFQAFTFPGQNHE